MRLQKYIADCGAASRRAAERLIADGRVRVNGAVVDAMGVEVDPSRDRVELDGRALAVETTKYYIMLHKPKNYVTTVHDDLGRPTVMELVQEIRARIYPVGRLDFDTSGLLLLTNDGEFANLLTHPSHAVNKAYIAQTDRAPSKDELAQLERGIELDGKKTAPARATLLREQRNAAEVKVTIHEGRNRQVRRMLEAVGLEVLALKRVSIGSLTLGNLPEGKWRRLNQAEINKLRGRGR